MSSSETASQRKSSSFANPNKQFRTQKRSKALTRDFFSQLIKLETDFHNKNYTIFTLDELIQFYARAVEYYDSVKDEISAYFIFKIQDVLATKKSLKMLLEQNTKKGTLADEGKDIQDSSLKPNKKKVAFKGLDEPVTSNENILEESSDEEDDDNIKVRDELAKKRQAKAAEAAKGRISISKMKYQKQRFVNFFYKIETHKASEKQNMKAVLNEFDKHTDKNDLFVKKDIDNQKARLCRRLDKRKVESFMSHTMNIQSFQFVYSADENKEFENFLDELDENEKALFQDGDTLKTESFTRNPTPSENSLVNIESKNSIDNLKDGKMNQSNFPAAKKNYLMKIQRMLQEILHNMTKA